MEKVKSVKSIREEIFKDLRSCSEMLAEIKAQQIELRNALDALGFTAAKQKPATSLKVIQGGLKS